MMTRVIPGAVLAVAALVLSGCDVALVAGLSGSTMTPARPTNDAQLITAFPFNGSIEDTAGVATYGSEATVLEYEVGRDTEPSGALVGMNTAGDGYSELAWTLEGTPEVRTISFWAGRGGSADPAGFEDRRYRVVLTSPESLQEVLGSYSWDLRQSGTPYLEWSVTLEPPFRTGVSSQSGSAGDYQETTPFAGREWVHVAFVHDPLRYLRVYVDGELRFSASYPTVSGTPGASPALILNGSSWSLVDDLTLYATPLGPADIRALANDQEL